MDIDQLSRALRDLEYRVKLLEKAQEVPVRAISIASKTIGAAWCQCGRDVCRAPDCPSHTKPDPMGR